MNFAPMSANGFGISTKRRGGLMIENVRTLINRNPDCGTLCVIGERICKNELVKDFSIYDYPEAIGFARKLRREGWRVFFAVKKDRLTDAKIAPAYPTG
jgi:hypothetical protein